MTIYTQEFAKLTKTAILETLGVDENGLSSEQIHSRQLKYGLNTIHPKKFSSGRILLRQIVGNPLIIILAIATLISYFMGQRISAYYIFGMISLSIILGFWNEFSAERTVQNLLKRVSLLVIVVRGGEKIEVPVAQLTIGDIVLLAPGSVIPADLRFIEASRLEVDESSLTGESRLVPKNCKMVASNVKVISDYSNIGFMGTTVANGWGKGVVVGIGKNTEYGKIAKDVAFVRPETDFQKGLGQFSGLITKVIIALTIIIFGVNAILGRSFIDSLLFALAIAVGLTPELLPVIVTISLSHGAGKLAKKHVISKQLIAIENLGNMDILCTDKTGTLTEGVIKVSDIISLDAKTTKRDILSLAIICNEAVRHHKVIGKSIDVSLWDYADAQKVGLPSDLNKISEEPFDYDRRLMFSVVEYSGKRLLVAKGSPEAILACCNISKNHKSEAEEIFESSSDKGLRLVALASKIIEVKSKYSWKDLDNLKFEGFITFSDIPKKSAKESLDRLESLGVNIKILTGDNEVVTRRICEEVEFPITNVATGDQLNAINSKNMLDLINKTNVFVRVTPEQKLMVIQMLQKGGHSVGFLGDGINDIPSLHNADVGISVNTAVDVAKDAASVVLIRKGLSTIADGIMEGRITFSNTLKYILMGTSSNFGNMVSAASASFFLPFLPMLPSQILLNNGLYDLSQVSIPSDNVDEEMLRKPRRWDVGFIRNYMLFFGLISSIYDFLTFGMMILIFNANGSLFQTGWFIESLATQVLVVFVIRTSRMPFYKSRAGKWLTITCLSVVGFAAALPYLPFASGLGFMPLPPLYFIGLAVIVVTYLALVSVFRIFFIKKYNI